MNPPGPLPAAPQSARRSWLVILFVGALVGVAPLAAQRGLPGSAPFPGDTGGPGPQFTPVRPVVICFPPTPPPLDRAISHLALPMPQRLTPPAELAAYLNEPFYAPLSTWLIEKTLPEKMRQRLEAFRAAKVVAVAELRAALDQTRDAELTTRRHTLETLARTQTPRLAALESDAEQIRAELAIGNFDWRALREWALGEKSDRGDSPAEIATVMRAYAFYQTGLNAGQRRLLREISLELVMAGEDATAAQAAQPFLFFSPEPARVMLGEEVPDSIAAAVADYQTKKSGLKKELFDAVYKEDSANFSFTRNGALKSLAGKQAPRLAELENLAEEIRRGLALAPAAAVPAPERSPLPPLLTARVAEVLQARTALQKDTIARVEAIRRHYAAEPAQISYSLENEILKFLVVPRRVPDNRSADELKEKIRAIEAEMTAVAEDYGRRFAELINDTEAIRRDAAQVLGSKAKPRDVDNAIGSATRAAALRESEDAYRDYRLAVFEPGMSPEQRRLLFGAALEKLDLPLPRGELQPMRRAASW